MSYQLHWDDLTKADQMVITMMRGSVWGDDARLTLPSGRTLTGAQVRELIAEIR